MKLVSMSGTSESEFATFKAQSDQAFFEMQRAADRLNIADPIQRCDNQDNRKLPIRAKISKTFATVVSEVIAKAFD